MERLIYSNTFHAKFHLNALFLRPIPCPRNPTILPFSFSAPSFRSLLLSRSGGFKFSPLCCTLNEPSFPAPNALDGSQVEDSGDGNQLSPNFLKWIARRLSQKQKVTKAGMVVLLSALCLTCLHSVVVSSAFASFQAATAGGPAVRFMRSEILSSAWTGFFAGCLHTLSGPDHLAALAPLSIGCTRMESAAVGALWGCGHDAGQVLFGLLFLLLKDKLHIEVIRQWGTGVVGLTLLAIGIMGIREASEVPLPCVVLEKGLATPPVVKKKKKKKIGFATFATGIVHGLQPDALMIILPALALPSRSAGAAFLIMFLVGTVMGMGSYTLFIGSCSQALKDRIPRITEKLTWASSLVAIALGLAIMLSQLFGFSLY